MNSKFLYNNNSLLDRRRELRKNPTEAEKVLWQRLSNRRLGGIKFVRQSSVGPYILDFYCRSLRLAIELDGNVHKEDEAKIYDAERERYLENLNIKTIRFWNEEVLKDMKGVLERVNKATSLSTSSA